MDREDLLKKVSYWTSESKGKMMMLSMGGPNGNASVEEGA
jgi:hypothetical protein